MPDPEPISPRGTTLASHIRRLLGLGAAALGVVTLGPASLLLIFAETRTGRLFGGVAALLLASLVAAVVLLARPSARNLVSMAIPPILAIIAAVAYLTLARNSPDDRPSDAAGLQSRFVGGTTISRYSPARVLPERDQVALGVNLVTRFVPWVSRARTIRETTLDLYRSIDADPAARGLGAVTDLGFQEILGLDIASKGHAFRYMPAPREGERLGVLVFLHGNGGNFQVLPWAWRSFAEEHRFVILCPTDGFGFWGGSRGVEAVDRAWDDLVAHVAIDPERVYLSGLSDGGNGVTWSGMAHPERYRGLIYISPTMIQHELATPRFRDGWRGRPILVVQGERDWSVLKSTVDPAVDLLRRQGSLVDYAVYPGEDHFLFFSKRLELFPRIAGWMAATNPAMSRSQEDEVAHPAR